MCPKVQWWYTGYFASVTESSGLLSSYDNGKWVVTCQGWSTTELMEHRSLPHLPLLDLLSSCPWRLSATAQWYRFDDEAAQWWYWTIKSQVLKKKRRYTTAHLFTAYFKATASQHLGISAQSPRNPLEEICHKMFTPTWMVTSQWGECIDLTARQQRSIYLVDVLSPVLE